MVCKRCQIIFVYIVNSTKKYKIKLHVHTCLDEMTFSGGLTQWRKHELELKYMYIEYKGDLLWDIVRYPMKCSDNQDLSFNKIVDKTKTKL